MAEADAKSEGANGLGTGAVIAVLALLTLVAGAAGFATGGLVIGGDKPPAMPAGEANKKPKAGHGEAGQDGGADPHAAAAHATSVILDLEPVVTNLAKPAGKWVRIEASIQLASTFEGDSEALRRQISEDFLVFTRTLSLEQISGGTGLSNYKEDITERAKIRSEGAVTEVFLKMLVVE